jgi:organic radical activating enzyme
MHRKLVVCTGGEPLLQLDSALVKKLQDSGFMVAVETNGTKSPPKGIDWICVSPKPGSQMVVKEGDELKLVFPQAGVEPQYYESLNFGRFFLQPMDGPLLQENLRLATNYCLEHPRWELSLQTHKLLGLR